jgi:hypothetical protein
MVIQLGLFRRCDPVTYITSSGQRGRHKKSQYLRYSYFYLAPNEKSVEEISARLDTLTVDQLERLKDYERRNKNRETLIREIDRRIGAAS